MGDYVEKIPNISYPKQGKDIALIRIDANIADSENNNIYIFDEYNNFGKLVSLDRYCIKDSSDQPFVALTQDEELILNPTIGIKK